MQKSPIILVKLGKFSANLSEIPCRSLHFQAIGARHKFPTSGEPFTQPASRLPVESSRTSSQAGTEEAHAWHTLYLVAHDTTFDFTNHLPCLLDARHRPLLCELRSIAGDHQMRRMRCDSLAGGEILPPLWTSCRSQHQWSSGDRTNACDCSWIIPSLDRRGNCPCLSSRIFRRQLLPVVTQQHAGCSAKCPSASGSR